MFFDLPSASLMPSWPYKRLRRGRARKIGRRRYARHRRRSNSKKENLEDTPSFVVLFLSDDFLWNFQIAWFLSPWNSPVLHWQNLTAAGGVAICPREHLPQVLTNVGCSAHPCGVVITQSPEEVHLKGYPRSRIRCTFDICNDDGDRQQVCVERYLVQFGFSSPVSMLAIGETLDVPSTVKKMVAKCSIHRGWPAGQNPSAILADFLAKFIPREAFSEIIARNNSFTFLCHESYCDVILRMSGRDGIFTKVHGFGDAERMELLWLDKTMSLEDATALVEKHATILGLAEKGQQGFLALRFRDYGDMVRFAKETGIEQNFDLQRWKVSGLPVTTGIAGVHQLLHSLKWEVEEVVYQDTDRVVFTCSSKGKSEQAHFTCEGQPRLVRFKALNASARRAAATENKDDKIAISTSSTRSTAQKAFMSRLQSVAAAPTVAAPASPRMKPDKQKATGNTGETPDGQKPRQ